MLVASRKTESYFTQTGEIMKTYCKRKYLIDKEFIQDVVYDFLKGDSKRPPKWKRKDYQRFISQINSVPLKDVRLAIRTKNIETLKSYSNKIANYCYSKINDFLVYDKKLNLPKFDHFTHYDSLSNKERNCVLMQPINQIMEFIALKSLQELFDKKIMPYQMASVRGRGQVKGKEAIEKWIRRDKKSKYYVKLDIVKCFPNLKTDLVMKFLERDIGKNKDLLKFIKELLSYYENGSLEIGTVLSASLCNYVLSYIYRYASNLTYQRRNKNYKCIRHQLFYMDDLFFIGQNKNKLDLAIKDIQSELDSNYNLSIHDYVIYPTTKPIDMMGYVISYDCTTIRWKIFKRIKRLIYKSYKCLEENTFLALHLARKLTCYWGYIMYTNSHKLMKQLNVKFIFNNAIKTISHYARKELYVRDLLLS